MENHALLFHIGMHKTGTTSLQRFLYDNSETLKKYGWTYPNICPDERLSYTNGSKLYMREWDVKRWEIIKKTFQDYNVIISEERYWADPSVFLNALTIAKNYCDNVKVIVYLRRQDRAVESMYNHLIRIRTEHGSIMDYMNQRPFWSNNYLDILDKISAIIGVENLIVRVYEKEQFEGDRNDIFSDFIHSLPGKPIYPNWNEFIFPEKQNLSFNGNFSEIKKICNSIDDEHNHRLWDKKQIREVTRICNARQQLTSSGLSVAYFTKQERIDLLDSQAKNNAEIAKKYLNRTDGKLFYDNYMDYPVYQDQATEFEKDMVLTLCSMLYQQQRKIEMAPAVAAVALLRKNRKLAFWGFGDNGKQLYDYVLLPDIIIDNDPNKCHKMFMDIPVIPSGEIVNWKEYFIVVTPLYPQDIEDVLLKNDLTKGEDYILLNDFFDYGAIY